jgi:hypothetical protein
MKALIVTWIADHWLIALVMWCAWAAAWLCWARWIMGKVSPVDRCDGDCQACETPCGAPIGHENADGFHLGAELMPHAEVERQLTAALAQSWDEGREFCPQITRINADQFIPMPRAEDSHTVFPKGRWL